MNSAPAGRIRRVLLTLACVFALGYQVRIIWSAFQLYSAPSKRAVFPLRLIPGTREIGFLHQKAFDAGLRPGDEVLALDGVAVKGRWHLYGSVTAKLPGQNLNVRISRAGGPARNIAVPLLPFHPEPYSWQALVVLTVLNALTPMLGLLLGAFVALRRPADPLAWLLLALLIGFSHMGEQSRSFVYTWDLPSALTGVVYNSLGGRTWAIWMLLFGYLFPDPKSSRRMAWFARWILIPPIALMGIVSSVSDAIEMVNLTGAPWLTALDDRLGRFYFYLTVPCIGLYFANLGFKMNGEPSPDNRRRVKLLYWGSTASLTPLFILILVGLFLRRDIESFPEYVWIPALLLLFLFPATLAYVIIGQRAMDVGVVIRQGLQYAFATRVVRVAQAAISIAVLLTVVNIASSEGVGRARRLQLAAVGMIAVLLLQRGATKAKEWVDRRFFRDAVKTERILSELGEEVREIAGTQPLLETVSSRLSEALHVPRVAILLAQNGNYNTAYAHGFGLATPSHRIPRDAALISHLQQAREPLRVYLDDPQCWINRDPALERERSVLEQLDTQLLLPVSAKGNLLGFVSLGAKQSDEPYTKTDSRLLQTVATQTALALENNRLAESIASEVASREMLQRELEIARQVQERLFPQSRPEVPGVDYAGACKPALSVGGDSFDYFYPAPGGRLAVAVGDVAGKGVPAALLMACLQASLRGLISGGLADVAELMHKLNGLVYLSTTRNRFATLFFAMYDPASRELTYASAGHNPALLVRRDGSTEWLRAKGMALGLSKSAHYEAVALTLAPGDLLVAYTDGVTEARNISGEDFGEERLCQVALRLPGSPSPEAACRDLIQAVSEFEGEAPQHDDMTVVIVRAAAA